MRLVGLTGGTGSGKSTAAKRFVERGIPVIDADAVGHEVIAPGGSAEAAVIAAFGDEIVGAAGIDREKLSSRVFGNDLALARLNEIVHPAIFLEIGRRCAVLAEAGHGVILIDAALLAEDGNREPWLSDLILVLADDEVRVRRLVEFRAIDEVVARQRIAAQTPPEQKRLAATWVIHNDGGVAELNQQVDAIADALGSVA